jgi:outer membrane cobalamin receptor
VTVLALGGLLAVFAAAGGDLGSGPRASGLGPRAGAERPQASGLRPQASGNGPQASGLRPQGGSDPEGRSPNPDAAAANASATPVFQTIVIAAPAPDAAPRADSIAASTVVFPANSPRAFDDLGDLLVEVPGVVVTRSGGVGDFATVSLRGSNPDEVRFYVDGVPLAVASGGSIDLSTLPLGDVERVEIYRGTTPIGFAESALGGIVSITTRAPAGPPRFTLRAGAGSFGTRFGDATASGSTGRLHVYAGAHAIVSDGFDYYNDLGTAANPLDGGNAFRTNNHLTQVDGAFRAAIDLRGRRQLGLGLIAFAREHGLPGPGTLAPSQAEFNTARGIAYASYDSRDDLGAGGRLHAQLFTSAQRDRFIDPNGQIGAIAARTDDTTLSAGATVNVSRPFAEWVRAAAMGEGRREVFQPVNALDPTPVGVPAERLVGAGGVETDFWWRRIALDIVPSARVEVVRDIVTGRDQLFQRQRLASAPIVHTLPIARLGLSRPLGSQATIKANAGRYGRAPSFLELYGDTGPMLGNPLLRPEVGWTGDLAAEYRGGGERASVAGRTGLFAARVDDLIEWVPISYSQVRVDNIGRARIWGVEQELDVDLGRSVRVTGQATCLDARDASDVAAHAGKQLPFRPRVHAYLRSQLRRLALGRALVGLAYVEGDLQAGAYRDSANIAPVGTRVLLGAGVEVDAPRTGLRLALSAKNLTNVMTFDVVHYPLPGRSIFLSLMWSNETKKE